MTDVKISALTAVSSLAGTEAFPLVQSGQTKTALITDLNFTNPNLLVNPFMEVDQANEGNAVTTTLTYVVDQWITGLSGSATASFQRVADGPLTYPNSVKITTTSGASIAAGSLLHIQQPIEAANLSDIAFGTANARSLSLTFWVRCSIASYVMSGSLRNNNGTRSYVFNVTINSANTWEKKTVTIPGDTSGTWNLSGANVGAYLVLVAAAGSTVQTTANTWASGNYVATASNTNSVYTTTSATFQISAVKLEVSNFATPLLRQPISDVLYMCQRYYRKTHAPGTKPGSGVTAGSGLIGAAASGSLIDVQWNFDQMRASPTLTIYDNAGTTGKISYFASAAWNNAGTATNWGIYNQGLFFVYAQITGATQIALDVVADARL